MDSGAASGLGHRNAVLVTGRSMMDRPVRAHNRRFIQGLRVAQAWALSINPRLDYESPIKAIREDRFAETAAAAKALLEDAYDG